jgi:hypothetical protein
VLKAHEGSTVERAALCGEGAVGGIVLNAPVGGANAIAVDVAGRLGGRIVWMPTMSSSAHRASEAAPELKILHGVSFPVVPVIESGSLRTEWLPVLDAVAAHDMVLASGHTACADTVVLFREARRRGVRRLLVNHPMMPFLGWDQAIGAELRTLDARLELGILPDLLHGGPGSLSLLGRYPDELLVFGSDLGHADHPKLAAALPAWIEGLVDQIGARRATAILTTNGRELIAPPTQRAAVTH